MVKTLTYLMEQANNTMYELEDIFKNDVEEVSILLYFVCTYKKITYQKLIFALSHRKEAEVTVES